MNDLLFDIETNALDFRDLSGLNRVHCMSYQWGFEADAKVFRLVGLDEISKFFETLEEDVEAGLEVNLWAHNGVGFDYAALFKLIGTPFLESLTLPHKEGSKVQALDTMLLAKLAFPDMVRTVDKTPRFRSQRNMKDPRLMYSHSLKAWGMRLGVHKGSIGDSTKAETWETYTEQMGDYCDDDVRVTAALLRYLSASKVTSWLFTPAGIRVARMERDFACLMRHQQTNGVGFDIEAAQKLASRIRGDIEPLEQEIVGVFPPTYVTTKTPEYWELRRKEDDEIVFKSITKSALDVTRKRWNAKHPKELQVMPKDHYYKAGPMIVKEIPFNPGSRQQIVERLKESYGWEPVEFTEPTDLHPKGQPKVNDEILSGLPYPEAQKLADLMARKKILSALDGDTKSAWVPNYKEDTGRIHGGIDTLGCNTSRCAHMSPNLGQVPSGRKVYGKECRQLFGPRPGWKHYGCDASGLELRALAGYLHTFDGGEYVDVVLNGDVHTYNQEKANLETRDHAKTVAYCTIYGGGVKAVAGAAGVNQRKAKEIRDGFLNGITGLLDLMRSIESAHKRRGYVFGLDRRHLFPRSAHSALNLVLQSAGAIIMKVALIELYWSLTNRGFIMGTDWALMLNVHDEYQLEFNPTIEGLEDFLMGVGPKSITQAGTTLAFKCPLDGESQVGDNWYDCH